MYRFSEASLPSREVLASALSGADFAYDPATFSLCNNPKHYFIAHCPKHSAEAILYEDEYGRIVLAFKGTKEPRDWLINIRAIPWKWLKGWSHRGFTVATRSIFEEIHALLDFLGEEELIVTGHSLGGAMAEKFCESLEDYPSQVHLITFGKPNTRFRPKMTHLAHLDTQLSVVHGSDLVSRVPKLFYGPDPAQNMLYLANSGGDYLDPPRSFILDDWKLADWLGDHAIDGYRLRIFNIVEGECECDSDYLLH